MSPNEIQELRKRLGLTQRELAERLGVCKQSVCNWETGRKVPYRIFMQKLEEMRDSEQELK